MPSDFLEKDLENIIFENLDKVYERGFPKLYKNVERQFVTNLGSRIDLFAFEIINNVLYAQVIELKKETCGYAALSQALNYYEEIIFSVFESFLDFHITVILVGNKIDYDLNRLNMLADKLSFYSYKYDFDGIRFEKEGFYVENIKHEILIKDRETEMSKRLIEIQRLNTASKKE